MSSNKINELMRIGEKNQLTKIIKQNELTQRFGLTLTEKQALQELFYIYKNQCMDQITDDELIEFMRVHFNGDCQGSMDFLEESCMDMLSRDIRSAMNDITADWRKKYEENDEI